MSRIERLVHLAVTGTRQAQPTPEVAAAPFDRLLAELPATLPLERKLLLLAGAEAIYALAGASTFPLEVTITPAAAEEPAPCSPGAVAALKHICQQPRTGLLPEALELLARQGRRLPTVLLPRILEALPASAAARSALAQVIGERGRWLASFQPSWQKLVLRSRAVTELSEPELRWFWREGSPDERVELLRQLRVHNRPLARQWLEEAWPKERLEQRLALLATFEIGLEEADEAFLEKVRGQRSSQERRLASALLVRLPSSACRRQLLAAADGLLQREERSEGYCVRPVLPEAYSPAWRHFGIEWKSLQPQQPASWLQALISLVPPGYWEEQLQLSPPGIVHSLQGEGRYEVLIGLIQATLLHRAVPWARALLSWIDPQTQQPLLEADELLSCLEQQEAEQFLQQVLVSPEQHWCQRRPALLARLPAPWSASFGRSFLEHLQGRIQDLAKYRDELLALPVHHELIREWQMWEKDLEIASSALPAACLDFALEAIQPPSPSEFPHGSTTYYIKYKIVRVINQFLEMIALRRNLLKELAHA
jgi:hypothetical protein